MKTEFKAKFLHHLLEKRKQDEGFTLIELLVVVIIIGILAAIALPSFLNQANKARASEAKTYVGSMNRAQQAFILENREFVTAQANFTELGLGIQTQTDNYVYEVDDTTTISGGALSTATPTTTTAPAILRGYVGTVAVGLTAVGGEATSLAILCESKSVLLNTATSGLEEAGATGTPITDLSCNTTTQREVS
ncbi:MAG: prepilin-type N-terminal cleavage/methylation domain-containing protein [Cyanothece sp. SIO1E1]|nr:prepilin-type N-terminal cleavage/methylation domain-containing protein [Cyanothece sp. SIO1E1]